MKNSIKTVALAVLGGAITLGVYKGFLEEPREIVIQDSTSTLPVRTTSAVNYENSIVTGFNEAAENSLNAVVHVKVASERKNYYMDPFDYFFGNGKPKEYSQKVWGAGSGVIIAEQGYIVTNNHVIEGADKVLVTLNDNREFEAIVVGSDPTTDIALIKIDADNLSPLAFTNSDHVRIGDWVLAVGNPFNLNSTVTAGIVSAKGRNIGILDKQSAIESFIQTDAVVNPGNSGGALVNTSGEIVGINTAISTHTGSFEGYSFAVPSNIVKKVVDDIMEYGTVQRGFIGVRIVEVSQPLVDEMNLDVNSGVYVAGVEEGGAAKAAGIREGDVITNLDGRLITKNSELLEQIGKKRPGDRAIIRVNRNGEEKNYEVILQNKQGTTDLYKIEEEGIASLGAQFVPLNDQEKRVLGIRHGIRISDIGNGKMRKAGIPENFVIVKVNNQYVDSPEEFNKIISQIGKGDGVLIQGFNKEGHADYFAFGL